MTVANIGIVGAGQIGGVAALLTLEKGLGNVVLYDVVPDLPQGKALDMNQMAVAEDLSGRVLGTNNIEELKECDVIIVTAGVPRKPGMSRDDLLSINKKIATNVATHIKTFQNQPFCILTTNPLDVMVMVFQEASGLPPSKVVGMAGILDVARYKYFISEKLKVASKDIRAQLLGGHGDLMVPVPSHTSINGIPLKTYIENKSITPQDVESICNRTRGGGGEIVALLKTGSAFNAPAAACIEMCKSFLFDEKRTLPCCCHLNGEYGYKNIYGGVPCVIGKNGIEKVIELELTNEEKQQFDNSMKAVKELKERCESLTIN